MITLTPQELHDAFCLYFSGAAKMINEREMEWPHPEFINLSIEFVDSNPNHVIVRKYRGNGSKIFEQVYINGLKHGTETGWYSCGSVWYVAEFENGKVKDEQYE